ncbi:Lsr2 family protein [Streptomyces sp. NPDC048506]|uniref:histone-like nucleoid-structuring protein Lsr2 n=1 Tax=Streptomyces sp. NPDC048506 TaxID=3155028 RepID=UPI003439D73D
MAQKIVTIYTDDLTGEESPEAATHTISIDGVAYEIDLGPDSYDHLMEAMGRFLKAGRKTGRARKPRRAATSGDDSAAIRTWARGSGYQVSDRGRVPAEIREAYEKAKK